MAAITPSTFDPLKRYVNVRLQQGVPIVDADWNELDDVRRFELRAYLKWYVGDGIPDGNDGFRVTGGLTDDVTITAGAPVGPLTATAEETALRHVGRCLVDGLDVLIRQDVKFTEQALYETRSGSAALATRLGVPVVAAIPATGAVLLYLDVWERLVTPDEQPDLVHTGLGVESCARTRREWVVRARAGTLVPKTGDADFLAGHSYLRLAQLTRSGPLIAATDLKDLRERRLLTPPAHLITDVLGVDPAAYRRGEKRPAISLREAVNALLAGQLPSSPDMPVSPGPGVDLFRRGLTIDSAGGLVAVWQSPRVGGVNHVYAARLDPAAASPSFTAAEAVTSGTTRQEPTVVAVPGGDLVIAYQTDIIAAGTDVAMKRGKPGALGAAAEITVAATAGVSDQWPQAVLCGDFVVIFTYKLSTKTWHYRRYRHTDSTFIDSVPQQLLPPQSDVQDFHAADIGGGRIVAAYISAGTLQTARLTVATNVVDATQSASVAGVADPFVLCPAPGEALVSWRDATGLRTIAFTGSAWGTSRPITGSDNTEADATTVLDPDGVVLAISSRSFTDFSGEVLLRRRNPVSGEWGQPQRAVTHSANDIKPYALTVPGQGTWLLWLSDRTGNFDLYAKRFITAI